jgi:hypothetical protein
MEHVICTREIEGKVNAVMPIKRRLATEAVVENTLQIGKGDWDHIDRNTDAFSTMTTTRLPKAILPFTGRNVCVHAMVILKE